MSQPTYNTEVMKELVQHDRYLAFVYKDLLNRNHEESDALKVLFNSNVAGDSLMESSYQEQWNKRNK